MPSKPQPPTVELNGVAPDGTLYKTTIAERERDRARRALKRQALEASKPKTKPKPSFTPDFKPSHASAMTRGEYMTHFYDKPKTKIGLNASLGQQSLLR